MTTITFDKLYWEKANPFRFVLPYFHDCQSRLKNDVALLAAAYIRMRLKNECTKLYDSKVDWTHFAAAYIRMRLILESGLQL